jgi:molecular chaperone GrpE
MSDSIPPAPPNENEPLPDANERPEGASANREGDGGGDPVEALRGELAKAKDAWMRTAADFDNFRKRTRREVDDAKKAGREDLLRAVLPVFDNIERAIQSAQRATDVKAVADGLSMVLRQFSDALTRTGIQKVPTIGAPFDPGVHEAIQQVETSDHAPGTVIAEVQPGYVQGDRLIRAAMVVVAKPKSEEETSEKN